MSKGNAINAFEDVTDAMTTDDLVNEFNKVNDRIELIALLAPLRLPEGLDENEKSKNHQRADSRDRAVLEGAR
jgi:hypothetical protein